MLFSLATATTSPPTSPLARTHKMGGVSSFFSHVTAATLPPPPPLTRTCEVGGVSSFFSLATAATTPPPPPLAHTREVGVGSCSFLLRRLPSRHQHPLSLAHARWGVFLCFSLTMAATPPPPPPLAHTCKVGVVLFMCDGHHITTTPSRSHARWWWVLVLFTCDGRHITATTPFTRNHELGVVPHVI